MSILSDIAFDALHGRTAIAQLIDPDHIQDFNQVADIVQRVEQSGVDYLFLGGSFITSLAPFNVARAIKEIAKVPVILFPASPTHINYDADGILMLSLISGRNPEYLIGHHVVAAPLLKKSNLEIIPTGYILVNCGSPTTAEYISQTQSIPRNKPALAAATALAGEMLGLKLIYLDGGSGADRTIDPEMIRAVKKEINLPLIVGGGIKTAEEAVAIKAAGADVVVIGNAAQTDPSFITEVSKSIK